MAGEVYLPLLERNKEVKNKMKTWLIIATLLFTSFSMLFAGDTVTRDFEVTVSTQSSVMGRPVVKYRKYLLAVNSGAYDIRVTSYPITAGTIAGIPIKANGGWIEDDFYVSISSWYFISVGAGSSSVSIREKE